jgi:hypothetical protein
VTISNSVASGGGAGSGIGARLAEWQRQRVGLQRTRERLRVRKVIELARTRSVGNLLREAGARNGVEHNGAQMRCALYAIHTLISLPSTAEFQSAAAQHILAAHHRTPRWTRRQASVQTSTWGLSVRVMKRPVAHVVEELVHEAFEKSWQFVRTDPVLAHGDIEELRTRLSRRVKRLAQKGERDVWRLANGAIAELRREVTEA